jgi:Concanavalin A-like lectin/glucanases superfamily
VPQVIAPKRPFEDPARISGPRILTNAAAISAGLALWLGAQAIEVRADIVRHVAPVARGSGDGTSAADAAGYLDPGFWAGVKSSLGTSPTTVRFLDGQYNSEGLVLEQLGHPANRLTLQGATPNGAVLNAPTGVMLQFNGVQNTTVRNLHFTGAITNYAFHIQGSSSAPSHGISIEECSWTDLTTLRYGALGTTYSNVHDITVKDNTFIRVGADAGAHMMYNAYGSYNLYLYNNYFEDCPGDYIRFRGNMTDFGEVIGNTFVSTSSVYNRPFVAVPLFNDVDPGDENFGTNFLIQDNHFEYRASGGPRRDAIAFYHQGYDPAGYNNLMTAAEGAILTNGSAQEKKQLLLANTGINGDRVHVFDNTFVNEANRLTFGSFASYGSVSKGWDGWADIYDVVQHQAPVPPSPNAPIVEFRFNGGGPRSVSSGSLYTTLMHRQWDGTSWSIAENHSPDASGVSGLPGDRAYNDPSVILGGGQAPGSANAHYFGGFAGGARLQNGNDLEKFTVQGWFKAPAGQPLGTDGSYSALIGNLGSSSNDGGWVVRTRQSASAGTLEFRFGENASTLDHSTASSTAGAFAETDQWVFFAVTLDVAIGRVEFFKGTTTTGIEAAGASTVGPLLGGMIASSDRNFYIGNVGSEGGEWFQARAFNGLLDNLRVYDRILSSAELDQLRRADITLSDLMLPLDGDYNFDGVVDAADYVAWRATDATQAGYERWRENFGASIATSTAQHDSNSHVAVPEPTAWISALGLVVLGGLGRRQPQPLHHAVRTNADENRAHRSNTNN